MFPAPCPHSAVYVGVRWPMLRQCEYMRIASIYIQLPDPRNIVLQRASRDGHTNSLRVRRKGRIARHHMVRVPNLLYVSAVSIADVDRFLFVERNQLPVRGVA